MAEKTIPWDVTEHLDSDEMVAAYLDAVFEEGNPDLVRAAILDVAKARGMTAIAKKAEVSRGGLYKALGEDGNPSFEMVESVMRAMGFSFRIVPATTVANENERSKKPAVA